MKKMKKIEKKSKKVQKKPEPTKRRNTQRTGILITEDL